MRETERALCWLALLLINRSGRLQTFRAAVCTAPLISCLDWKVYTQQPAASKRGESLSSHVTSSYSAAVANIQLNFSLSLSRLFSLHLEAQTL